MATQICALYVLPPIAIARLGGSSTPLEAYQWVESPDPRANGETAIEPAWSLRVRPDATVEPYLPDAVQFRDGGLIRPVCPFFEIHALLGDPATDPASWVSAPLTPELLAAQGFSPEDVALTIDAQNHKVSRRTDDPDLRFGTFPPVTITAAEHQPVPLKGQSPPGVADPLIPRDQPIPLGSVQVLRSLPQPLPSAAPWAAGTSPLRVDVLRFRFTPATGLMYGPKQASKPLSTPAPRAVIAPVDPERAFLSSTAGWWKGTVAPTVVPGDTYDGADGSAGPYGVVDDTCEALVTVTLGRGRSAPTARCNIFVGPPDFGPDRRPFLSLADELNDRAADGAVRSAALGVADRDAWVRDLFSRIYETVSLMNVDVWRASGAMALSGAQLRGDRIVDDHVPQPRSALGGFDALRDPVFAIPAGNPTRPLPITAHARWRHQALMDLDALRNLVAENPGLLRRLVRGPFEVEAGEDGESTSMRMPPFMRNSNAFPLTLASWQFDLLMKWVASVEAGADTVPTAAEGTLAARAEVRKQAVLDQVRRRRT
ncbi:MAG: hypothetical protein JSR73_08430 [Proteobacteria bacterium]|nr:hypothetical protein [Pseudomonadota bacterium]